MTKKIETKEIDVTLKKGEMYLLLLDKLTENFWQPVAFPVKVISENGFYLVKEENRDNNVELIEEYYEQPIDSIIKDFNSPAFPNRGIYIFNEDHINAVLDDNSFIKKYNSFEDAENQLRKIYEKRSKKMDEEGADFDSSYEGITLNNLLYNEKSVFSEREDDQLKTMFSLFKEKTSSANKEAKKIYENIIGDKIKTDVVKEKTLVLAALKRYNFYLVYEELLDTTEFKEYLKGFTLLQRLYQLMQFWELKITPRPK